MPSHAVLAAWISDGSRLRGPAAVRGGAYAARVVLL